MHVDFGMHRTRNRPWQAVLATLMKLAGGKAELLHHGERTWASATFAGTRHTVMLAFAGADAVPYGEVLIDVLPDHEFAIPGQLVADATVVSVEHTTLPEPRLIVEAELLLLDED